MAGTKLYKMYLKYYQVLFLSNVQRQQALKH